MNDRSISDTRPAGLGLLTTSESFLKDLSETDEALITGGARSSSNSGRRRQRRPVRRGRARRVVRRSISRT